MPEACLRHVLASEGQDWFRLEKLTQVIDTYTASRGDVKRNTGAGNRSPKLLARVTPPQPKPVATEMSGAISNQRKVLRCYSCGKMGHRSFECRSTQSSAHKPMKPSPDRQDSSTISNTVTKARVNHAGTNVSEISVTSPSLTHWLGAKPIIDIPEIRIPSDEFYAQQEMIFVKIFRVMPLLWMTVVIRITRS